MFPADAPAVTVVLPVRNGAATIEAAVRSILGQTLTDFELLVVDDGSTDATGRILAGLAGSNSRLRVIAGSATGLVAALNRGLAEARGPLVARMDADDLAAPTRLARQVPAFADPALALLGAGWRVVGPRGETRRVVLPPHTDAGLRTAMARANALAHPTAMFRLGAVRDAGLYRPAFLGAEDYDLWLRLAEHGRIGCVPDILLDYREHPGQVSWRGLEQRIWSELGAQAASRCRAQGRPDYGDGPLPIGPAELARMGVGAAELAAETTARALGAAKDARRAGHRTALRQAARLGLRQPGLRLRTRLHLGLLWAQGTAPRRAP